MAWQYTVLTKEGGLLVTAGDTEREKQTLLVLVFEFPLLNGIFSTCFCSSPIKILLYQGFSLTPPFSRQLLQKDFCSPSTTCFTCKQKSSCHYHANELPLPYRFLPLQACQLHKGKSQHPCSLHWLPRPVAGALSFLPPAQTPPSSPPQMPLPTASSANVDVTSQIQKARFPSGSGN